MNNYNRICGIGEMELNMDFKNQNQKMKSKKKKKKSNYNFQAIFEIEIRKLNQKGEMN